ncbi:glycosyltransferase family 32 protein [Vibrio sonorensis]|uniref:glycosyltransferase family 32 protein n=1 Tax=Vibrio sonorensis TaxID=1004316 RepID=UPI0008DAF07F|nr:glycosyltransferase [Vibrio sonorensis]
MNKTKIVIANRLIRLVGNIFKVLSYPFHWLFPKKRFAVPNYSAAKVKLANDRPIPRVIWQTNFTDRYSLPMYMNYLFNRLMSLNCEYRLVTNEGCTEYLKTHAPKEVYDAYSCLNDGAAKADLWRLFVLYREGGVYLDMDATLVWPIDKLLGNEENALYIKIANNTEITNYFIASHPGNPDLAEIIDQVVHNINNYTPDMGVYSSTGPTVLHNVLANKQVHTQDRKYVCIQGAFSNEHFQYIDKPRGKWIHMNPEDLIKKND